MKNIKTSKIVALVLSLAMIVNVFAGLSLTSFAADVAVGMYFMDQNNGYSTPTEFVAGQSYTAVVTLAGYNATNAAAYPISGLQVDVALDSAKIASTGYVGTYEKSGYSFDGTTDFASKTTDDNGNAIVRFASVYGAPGTDGGFEYTALASSEATIELFAFVFTVAENATGEVSFPMTVIASDASLAPYEFVVNNRTMNITAAAAKTEISLYGPDLQAINPNKDYYNIDDATKADGNGYTPFGTSWKDAGFAEGSSVVRMGYNNFVYLGEFDFSNVTKIEITYATDATFPAANVNSYDAVYSLGLRKSAGSFGWAEPIEGVGTGKNFVDVIAVGELTNGTSNGWAGRRTVTITEGIDTTYSGGTWLTSYACNGHVIAVTEVVLYRADETPDPTTTTEPTTEPTVAPTESPITTVTFNFNTDAIYTDSTQVAVTGIGGTSKLVWSKYGHLPKLNVKESFVIQGWLVSNYNIASYEYSVNGGEWVSFGEGVGITERPDLATSNPDTYTTAGFGLTLPVSVLNDGASNTVDFRFVDVNGNTGEFVQYTIFAGEAPYTEFQTSIDWYWVDSEENKTQLTGVGGLGTSATIAATITIKDYVRFAGWVSTTNGIKGYQYSLDGSTWTDLEGEGILARPDLITNNIQYADTGADTAGFDIVVDGEFFAEGTNALSIRAVDQADKTFKIFDATIVYEPEVIVTPTYTVSVGTVSNGTVTVAPNGTVDEGTTVTVTATPAANYVLDKILVNGTAISGTTFTVTADSVVTATFKKVQYAVSVGTVSNGTVTLSKTGSVDYGTTITVTATPAANYVLDKIFVNGSAIEGTTFTVTAASVVTATFKKVQYTVSVGTVSNGTVTLSQTGSVDYGTTITVTATANDGYELNQILVNGTAISGTTFTVTANSVVTATFTEKVVEVETYTITIVKGGKGTGNVTVVESAKAGDAITLTAAGTVNAAGYACVTTAITSSDAALTTTKAKTGAYTGATFTMPAANVTITVNFQVLGDTNLNGSVNATDATQAMQGAAGSRELTEEKKIAANVAGTSNANLNGTDATHILAYATGSRTSFVNGKY